MYHNSLPLSPGPPYLQPCTFFCAIKIHTYYTSCQTRSVVESQNASPTPALLPADHSFHDYQSFSGIKGIKAWIRVQGHKRVGRVPIVLQMCVRWTMDPSLSFFPFRGGLSCGGPDGGCWWLCVYVLGPSKVGGSGVWDKITFFLFNRGGEEDEGELRKTRKKIHKRIKCSVGRRERERKGK